MRSGVIAQKLGMTRIFTEAGEHIPVTVLKLDNVQVVGHRTNDKNGYTALHDAIWQNHIDTARVMIEAGADLTLKSHSGETPLAFAQSQHRGEIADIIERRLAAG